MGLTDFEKEFLYISDSTKDKKNFNSIVIFYFYQLLEKVEKETVRDWTVDLLRNYVAAFYKLSFDISQKNVTESSGLEVKNHAKAVDEKGSFNIYEGENSDISVFFTGLYASKRYCGLKNGLYFLRQNKEIFVMSREELLCDKKFNGCEILKNLNHRESFENEITLDSKLKKIEHIVIPKIIPSHVEIDTNKDNWAHILIDGIDNLPSGFIKSFFNLKYESPNPDVKNEFRKKIINESRCKNDGSFENYQKIMIRAIKQQIGKDVNLPIIYYKKQNEYNYLLPIYLQRLDKPDFCAILGPAKKSGEWKLMTLLNMDEAYCDIRVFGKAAVESVMNWW